MKKKLLCLSISLSVLFSCSSFAENALPRYVQKNIEIGKNLNENKSIGYVLNGTSDNVFSIPLRRELTEKETLKYAQNRLAVDKILTNATLFTTGTASDGEKVLYIVFALDNVKEFGEIWFELNSEKYKDYKKIWMPNVLNNENTGVVFLYRKMFNSSNVVNFFNGINYRDIPDLMTLNNQKDYEDSARLDNRLIYNTIVSLEFEKVIKGKAEFLKTDDSKREKFLNIYKFDDKGNLIEYKLKK